MEFAHRLAPSEACWFRHNKSAQSGSGEHDIVLPYVTNPSII